MRRRNEMMKREKTWYKTFAIKSLVKVTNGMTEISLRRNKKRREKELRLSIEGEMIGSLKN